MTKKVESADSPTFSKNQFLESKQFTTQQKDVLNALLQDGADYTSDEVIKIVDEFHRKVVE